MMKRKPKPNKKKGQDFEDKVQKTLNSGALWFDKGDLKDNDFVYECKFTEKKGFRITTKLLEKIWDEALDSCKLPRLVIGIEEEKCRWTLTININKEAK